MANSYLPVPLKDESRGRMKGWPGGELWCPGGKVIPTFRPALQDESPAAIVRKSHARWIYCKYCYKNTLPLALYEHVSNVHFSVMIICAECGYGLEPPEDTTREEFHGHKNA